MRSLYSLCAKNGYRYVFMLYVEIRKAIMPFFTDAHYFCHCGPFLESGDCFEAQCDIRTGGEQQDMHIS
jgi:hypothetical protein